MYRIIILFLICTIGFAINSEVINFRGNLGKNHLFNIESETDAGMEIIFSMHQMVVEESEIDGQLMKTYGVPGIFLNNDEGAPNLQGTGRYIAIPQGATARFTIIDKRIEVYKNIDVAPAPNIPLDNDDSPLRYVKNDEIYSRNEYYPSSPVRLSEPMQIRGVDCVILGITPFQYNPITKELVVYKDLRVRVDFEGGNGHFGDDALRNIYWEPLLQGHLLNYSSLPKIDFYAPSRFGRDGYEYIIIVPDDPVFIAWADTIKRWRKLQGISTNVYTLTQVGGNTITTIKNFLATAYNTWNPRPVGFLLLSDYQTSGKTYGITSRSLTHPYMETYVMDNFYADINGDSLPDMFHGRITAQSETQLSVMIRKFLNYERNPYTDASYYNQPIVCAAWQTERWFQLCGEVIRGFLASPSGLNKNPTRLYAIYSGTPTAGGAWSSATNTSTVVNYFYNRGWLPSTTQPNNSSWWNNGSNTLITQAINAGAFLLQHRDHGYEQGWGEPAYSNTDISNLTNDKLIFVNSHNCLTGRYDYSSEVFTEKFHRWTYNGANSGALAVNAASQVSYSFVNDAYAWGMYDCMWQHFMPDYPATDITPANTLYPCAAMNYGKYFLRSSSWPYNTSDKVITYNLFHHHGDVFNPLYTQVPQNLTVSHASTLMSGVTSFTVTANDSAIIALTVNNEIIGVGLGTGSPVNITIPGQAVGNTMIVTVTKVNYYRYSASVLVTASNVPYVITGKIVLNDSVGNGQVNPGELINYGVYAKNVGGVRAGRVYGKLSESDAYMSIIRDSVWFGTIQPNDSVLSNPYYQFRAANNCPNGRTVNFSLLFKDSLNNTWSSGFSVTVYAPDITYQSNVINGGNGDGILNVGETANILVTLKNEGGAIAANCTTRLKTTSPYITINDSIGYFGNIGINSTVTNSSDPYTVTVNASTPSGTSAQFSVIVKSGVYCDTLDFSLLIDTYFENFESSNGSYVVAVTDTWQWGTPANVGPSSAYSGTKCWGTKIAGNYSNNNNWRLTSREFVTRQNVPTLKFWHWYDFEYSSSTAYDGGNVKISLDSGVTWTVIRPTTGYGKRASSGNFGIPSESCFYSTSTTWQQVEFPLSACSTGRRFFIRWHFGSDNTIVKPGWYIDDVTGIGFTAYTGITKDVGVDAIIYPTTSHQVSTALQPIARVKNYATATQTNFQVICSIVGAGGANRYSNTQTITSLSPGDTVRLNFGSWTPSIIEQCTVKIRTKLTGDQNTANDRLTGSFAVGDYIPPAVPALLLPADGSTLINPSPQLVWQLIADAVQYNIVVSMAKTEVVNTYLSETSYVASNLNPGDYYWQVRARDAAGNWSDYSPSRTFSIVIGNPGWTQKSNIDTRVTGKYVKDGGALVGADNGSENIPYALFALRGNKSNEFYCFDTAWQSMPSMPYAFKPDLSGPNFKTVAKGGALCFNGVDNIYATKGNNTRELWTYSLAASSWRFLSFIPNPPIKAFKGGTALAFKNGKVYILVGGVKAGLNNFYAYDTLNQTWSALTSAPTADGKAYKEGSCIVMLADTIFCLKGKVKDNYFGAYDINANTWSARSRLPFVHPQILKTKYVKDGGAMTTDGSVIYAIKGGGSNEFWVYTPATNNWSALPLITKLHSKSVPKSGAALAYDGLRVALLKGNNQNEFWQYLPYTTLSATPLTNTISQTIQTELPGNNLIEQKMSISPNPLSTGSRVFFTVKQPNRVQLKLYNNLGYLVAELLNQELESGNYAMAIARSTLKIPSGVYHLRYENGRDTQSVKLIVR